MRKKILESFIFLCLLFSGCGGGSDLKAPGSLMISAFIKDAQGNEVEVNAEVLLAKKGEAKTSRGKTPLTIDDLTPGLYELELSFPGFIYSTEIAIEEGQTTSLSATLRPEPPPDLPF